jgi:hypothetical protein
LGLDGRIREIGDEVEDLKAIGEIRDKRITALEEASSSAQAAYDAAATPSPTPAATESGETREDKGNEGVMGEGPNLTEYDELTVKETLTSVGKTYLADTNIAGTLTVGLITFDELENSIDSLSGPLKLQANALQSIEFEGGKIAMDTEGNLHIKEGVIYGNESIRGSETVGREIGEIRVIRDWEETGSPVSVTATPSWNTTVWVTDITENGFTINFGTAPEEEQKVYWQALW